MKNLFRIQNLGILLIGATLITSCNLFKKKPEKSASTGWTYNDPNGSGFRVSKEKEQKTGPGLVFVEGGTFTMGAVEEDVMRNVVIEHKGYRVDVGSGFNLEQRRLYKENPELILGKQITVQYFEMSTNMKGTESLRFPTFKAIYDGIRDI